MYILVIAFIIGLKEETLTWRGIYMAPNFFTNLKSTLHIESTI